MDFKEAYETLELKFTSGNPIPVERSTILAKEWEAIKGELDRLKKAYISTTALVSLCISIASATFTVSFFLFR